MNAYTTILEIKLCRQSASSPSEGFQLVEKGRQSAAFFVYFAQIYDII